MPPLPNVAKCLKADFHYGLGTNLNALVRTHFSYTGGPPTTANLNALAAACGPYWVTAFQALTQGNVSYDGATITDLDSNTGAQGNDGIAHGGTRAGGPLPAQTSVILNHGIARRYRGGKPRTYLPALSDSDLSSPNLWSAAAANNVATAWSSFMAAIIGTAGIGITLVANVNVSYFSGYTLGPAMPGGFRKKIPTPRAVPLQDVITGTTANLIPGSQRRRMQHSR